MVIARRLDAIFGGFSFMSSCWSSCFDLLGFLDFFSYCGFYVLLAVVVHLGVFLYYPVYFLDHRHWDAYALPVVFSINSFRHVSSKSSGRLVLKLCLTICQNMLVQNVINIDYA